MYTLRVTGRNRCIKREIWIHTKILAGQIKTAADSCRLDTSLLGAMGSFLEVGPGYIRIQGGGIEPKTLNK